MNYRHAYHAGNFADCFKHALLIALLDALAQKPAPFFVLDTHAGAGRYDLGSSSARRTTEAQGGILRLLEKSPASLGRYLRLVQELGVYPGSPVLIRAAMRAGDRLTCCEIHPDDVAILRRQFQQDKQVQVLQRSGWEALGSLLPPKEKRGLIFIDPPFESRDEFHVLEEGLRRGHARFGHGVFTAWYPIKRSSAVRNFHANLKSTGIRDIITVELRLREATDPTRLNGCGLIVINPPHRFETGVCDIAGTVLEGLGNGEGGAGVDLIRLTDE